MNKNQITVILATALCESGTLKELKEILKKAHAGQGIVDFADIVSRAVIMKESNIRDAEELLKQRLLHDVK